MGSNLRQSAGIRGNLRAMKKLLIISLLVLVGGTGATQQKDLGVPAKDGVVVCTSAPSCDAGAEVLAGFVRDLDGRRRFFRRGLGRRQFRRREQQHGAQ